MREKVHPTYISLLLWNGSRMLIISSSKAVFGLFERFSTFSAVTFNAVLGIFLLIGKLGEALYEMRKTFRKCKNVD